MYDSDLISREGRVQESGVEQRFSCGMSAYGGGLVGLGVWKSGSSMIGSLPKTGELSIPEIIALVPCS